MTTDDMPSLSKSLSLALAGWLCAAWLVGISLAAAAEASEIRGGCELEFRPYCFTEEDGQPTGFGPDLLRAVADRMGLPLRITAAPWDKLWNDLVTGNLDVLPVVAHTPGRESLVDFSLPHTQTFDAFFVREGRSPIKDLAAATGKEIVVLREDAAHHQLVERKFVGKIIPVESIPDGMTSIAAGQHDAFLCSKMIGILECRQAGIKDVTAGPPIPDYKRVFAFAVRKGNTELLEKLNQGLLIVKTDGSYERIYRRWLTVEDPWRKWSPYFQWAVATAAVLAGLVIVLQWLVRRRTRELVVEIAERRKAEAALQQLNATLEQRVTERTAELQAAAEFLEDARRTALSLAENATAARQRAEQAAAALRESEERYRSLFENMLDGFAYCQMLFDEQGRPDDFIYLGVNESFGRMTGLKDVVGRRVTEVIPRIRELNPELFEIYGRVARTAVPERFEIDFKPLSLYLSVSVYCPAPGYFVAIFENITARKQAEEALRESEARMQQALQVSHSFTFEWTPATDQVARSASCAGILKLSGEEAVRDTGQHYFQRVHPDDRDRFVQGLSALTSASPSYLAEYRIACGDGSVAVLEEVGQASFDAAGGLVRLVGVTTDITERKAAEEQLRRANLDLETVNATLREARERAEWLARFPQENPSPVLRVAADGRVLYANPAAAENGLWTRDSGTLVVEPLRMLLEKAAEAKAPIEGDIALGEKTFSIAVAPFPLEGYANLYGRDVTERRRAEEAVARAKQEWERTFNSVPDLIAILDANHRIVRVNRAFSARLGKTPDEAVGLRCFEVMHGCSNPVEECPHQQTLCDGRDHTAEVHEDRLNGDFLVTTSPIRDAAGRPVGAVHVARDITEQKRAEAREREALALASASRTAVDILDAMGEGVLLLDMEGRIVLMNPAMVRISGIPAGEAIGQTFHDFVPEVFSPDDQAFAMRALAEAQRGHIPHLTPLTVVGRSVRRVPVIPSVTFACGADGQPKEIVVTLRDISELRAAQESLVESERKYRELVENANSIIMRITPDHTITFFNEYAQTFFGYAADEVLGRNVLGTIVPGTDSDGRDLRQMLRAISEHPELHGSNENENVRKDGRRVWIHWANRAIRDAQGKVVEILCVGTDITRRREMEAEARRYQQRLRELAKRLSASEEEDRWRISRYIHDTIIQNLSLATIRLGGMGEALAAARLKEKDGSIREVRGLIEQAVDECRMVMSDLTPALLYELGLVAALNELALQVKAKHNVNVIVEDDGWEESLSKPLRGLLFESARELIMNAVKHAGPCEIRVTLIGGDKGLTLRVEDNGKVFDPAAGHAHPDHKGGFGLFSIRQRMEGLGGRLELQSTPGQGTTATITVPPEESLGTGQ